MKNFIIRYFKKIKVFLVDRVWRKRDLILRRTILLFLSALIGVFLAKYIPSYILDFLNSESNRLRVNIIMVLLGLPVLFTLWRFKTHDTKKQIEQSEKQIQQSKDNIDNSSYFNAVQMLAQQNSVVTQSIGLKQLLYLKNVKKVFQKEIDLVTQYITIHDAESQKKAEWENRDLSEIHLRVANLHGADLRVANLLGADLQKSDLIEVNLEGANLREAKLYEAKLEGANLREANLQRANLRGANLQGADLQLANLKGADLYGAKLKRAKYDNETQFPEGFNPEGHGMIKVG